MTDEELLGLLADKETVNDGFRLLVKTYGDRLYQHILRIVNNRQDTDDILQNTFVKIYRGHTSFKGNSQLYTWLYRIATNETLSHLAQQKRRLSIMPQTANEQDYLLGKLKAEPEVEAAFIQQQLQMALAQLPPKQRAVFSLRYFEEKSYREMSAVLSTSEGALKASYHHAVKKMEAYLENL